MCVQCEYGIFRWCLGVLVSYGGVILALCCQWGQRNVRCHGGVVQSWRCGCYGKKHSCVLCSECRTVFQSVPHRPCGNLGRLICKRLMMKIRRESGLCLSRFSMVLFIRNTIFRSVYLNTLVMYSVSLPM